MYPHYREYRDFPQREEPKRVIYDTAGLGGPLTLGRVLVAIIIIIALLFAEVSPVLAVVAAALFYGVTDIASQLIMTGTITEVISARQDGHTRRYLYERQYRIMPKPDPPLIEHQPEPEPEPASPNYVSAADQDARREALVWVNGLFGEDGQLDPKRVVLNSQKEAPGRIRLKGPKGEAKELLQQRGMIRQGRHGYWWNVDRYPTIGHVRGRI